MKLYCDRIASPMGEITIVSDGEKLRAVDFEDYGSRMLQQLERHYGAVTLSSRKNPGGASAALRRYLNGDLHAIDKLPVATTGTAFQQRVWKYLRKIPAGKTWSYGQLARTIGNPKASRAVGLANGRNPVAIVVPCHRVIGANGALTGYGGGMSRKHWLLAHEGVLVG